MTALIAAAATRLPPVADPAALSPGRKVIAFASMCVGFFIALLEIQIVSASLQDIGGGLSASQDEIAWVQTSYLIAEIIVIPLSGFLARVMSTRWLFCASAVGFTLTSLLCGWAWDIQSMIVFRAMQGFLGGSMIPTVFTTAFAFFQGQKVVVAAATIGALASFAPTLGPTVGGWITDTYSWHWLFFVNVVPGAFIAIAVPLLVRIDRPNDDVAETEAGPAGGGGPGPAAVLFVWRSLSYAHPVVDLRALGSRNFALGCFFSFVTGVGLFSTIYLTPLFLARVRGFDAWQTGLAIFSTGLFQLLAIPVYAALAKRVDLRWLMMAGLACFGLGLWLYTPITHDWGWRELLLPQAFRGFAQQFAVAPTVTLTLGGLPPERLKLASGLFNLMRNLGGAIGIAACGTVLNDRANLHFLRIAEHLTPANGAADALLGQVGARYAAALDGDAVRGHAAALKRLYALAWREAQVLTFADAFLLIAACFVVATLMVPLMRRVAPRTAPPADAH